MKLTPQFLKGCKAKLVQAAEKGAVTVSPTSLMQTLGVAAADLGKLMKALDDFKLIRRIAKGDHLVIELTGTGVSLTAMGTERKPDPVPNTANEAAYVAGPNTTLPENSFIDQLAARMQLDDDAYFENAIGAH